jgi:hypothetical protein
MRIIINITVFNMIGHGAIPYLWWLHVGSMMDEVALEQVPPPPIPKVFCFVFEVPVTLYS